MSKETEETRHHTPGPWHVDCRSSNERPGISNPDGTFSIVVIAFKDEPEDDSGVWGKTRQQELANAQLMASAPRLLDALEALVAEYEDRMAQFGSDYLWQKHEDQEVLTEAKAAIAEATQTTK
jgi:hypothetical protein